MISWIIYPFFGLSIFTALESNRARAHATSFNFTPRGQALARGSLVCRCEAALFSCRSFNHGGIGSVLHGGGWTAWTASKRTAFKLQRGNVTWTCGSLAHTTSCFLTLLLTRSLAFSRPPPTLAHQLRICQLLSRSLTPPTGPTRCKTTH